MSCNRSLAWLSAALVLGCVVSPQPTKAQTNYENYTFLTFAGPQESPGWFDGTNSAAVFNFSRGVAMDRAGNTYVADTFNSTIRKVTPTGAVMTMAGLAGFTGTNDGISTAARFYRPFGLAVDTNGNVYVADTYNQTIRKITPAGAVTTLAGSPGLINTNDGTGSAARFNYPLDVAVDTNGTVYVADNGNHTIRKITPGGVVTTFAGQAGVPGSANGTGTGASFNAPGGVTVGTNGAVFVADTYNHAIRKITAAGVVSIFAGAVTVSGTNNGTLFAARFDTPFGITADTNGNLYVADTYNHTIRKVTAASVVTTVAGLATVSGRADGTNTTARFNYPTSVAVDHAGNVSTADYSNNLLRRMATNQAVVTLAGRAGGAGSADGTGTDARFNYPSGMAMDGSTNLYVADLANHIIRKITPAGVVTTLAGLAGTTGTNNGTGAAARFNTPISVGVDTNGNVYVADTYNHTVRKITPAGVVTNFAGLATVSGTNNGTGTAARFNSPWGVTVGTNGNVYVADTGNNMIRMITPAGVVTTLAGSTNYGGGDGVGVAATFSNPAGIAADKAGNLYVTDRGNYTVRKITPAGAVSTLAGLAGNAGAVDATGTNARLFLVFGVAVDGSNNVYVTESIDQFSGGGSHTIRKITPAGVVTTLGGIPGVAGSANGSGWTAHFYSPQGIAVTPDGNVFVADSFNHAIRRGYSAPPDMPVVDVTSDKPGVLRHLDVTNLTTTGWSWSIVRYPANAVAQLSATTIKNPTFTPDLADLYAFRFEGTNSAGKRAIGILDLSGVGTMQPYLKQIQKLGSNVVLTGNGGAPGAGYSMLKSPDTALPVGSWSILPGSTFDNNGAFTFTNALNGSPNFYKLRVP